MNPVSVSSVLACALLGVLVAASAVRADDARGILPEFLKAPSLSSATEEDKDVFARIKISLLNQATEPMPVLEECGETYFWLVAHRLQPLMKAYEYSRDPAFVDAFVPLLKAHVDQRFVHATQGDVWHGYYRYRNSKMGYMPMHASISYYVPALLFISAVRADEALTAKYGELAEEYYRHITEVGVQSWDKRGNWHQLSADTGWYAHATRIIDAEGNLVELAGTYGGSTQAYNKIHEFMIPLVMLYQMTGDAKYRDRVRQCERFFRSQWRIDDAHVEWNYRDFSGPWDYKNGMNGETKTSYFIHPKGGYYLMDVKAICRIFDAGVFFTPADIHLLIKTNLEFMWFGEKDPLKFRQIHGGYEATGKYRKGYLWTPLARYDQRIRDLWELKAKEILKRKGWGWEGHYLDYLLAMTRPVTALED